MLPQIYNTAVAVDSEEIQKLIRKLAMVLMNWAGRSEDDTDHLDHVDAMVMINQCIDHWLQTNLNGPVFGPHAFDQQFGQIDFGQYMAQFPTAAKQYAANVENDAYNREDYRTMVVMSQWFTQCVRWYATQLRPALIDFQQRGMPVTGVRSHDMVPNRSQLFIITSDAVVALEQAEDSDEFIEDEPSNGPPTSYL